MTSHDMIISTTEKPSPQNSSSNNSKTINHDNESIRYRGVRKRKWSKWVSEIRLPNSRERIWLGSYDTAEKGARAFDAALFCLRGKGAKFNFPDNPPDIPGGESLSRVEIQAAAAKYANEEPKNENQFKKEPVYMDKELLDLLSASEVSMSENSIMSDFGECSDFHHNEFLPLPHLEDYPDYDYEDTNGSIDSNQHWSLWSF